MNTSEKLSKFFNTLNGGLLIVPLKKIKRSVTDEFHFYKLNFNDMLSVCPFSSQILFSEALITMVTQTLTAVS